MAAIGVKVIKKGNKLISSGKALSFLSPSIQTSVLMRVFVILYTTSPDFLTMAATVEFTQQLYCHKQLLQQPMELFS